MKYLLDTGPLVALLDENESPRLRKWAIETLSALPWPLYTCEPVLTVDANDFAVYRRFGRDALDFISPPKT
jgi:hypothetical protein